MRIAMFVANPVTHDARVRREAATLAEAGHDVVVVGTLLPGKGAAASASAGALASEWAQGYRIVRVTGPDDGDRRWRRIRSAPWQLRGELIRGIVRAVRRGPAGWPRAAALALLVIPWAPWSVIRYLLPGRGKPRGPGDGLDWLMHWRMGIGGWASRAAAAAGPADAFHGHDLSGAMAARDAVRRVSGRGGPLRPRLVYDSHEVMLESGRNARQPAWAKRRVAAIEHEILRAADELLTVNPAVATELLARYGTLPPLTVVHNCPPRPAGVPVRDGRLRAAAGVPPDAPLVLTHGRIAPERGIEPLVEAMTAPGLERAHLVMLGDGPLVEPLLARAAALGIGDRVHHVAPVPPDELPAWIADADVGTMPIQPTTLNHRISTPNKLFECLAAGVPVVASDMPGMAAIVGTGDEALGALCDPTDPAAIAAALRAVLDLPPDAAAALRARCLAAARDRWNWEHESAGLVAVHAGAAAGEGQAARTASAARDPGDVPGVTRPFRVLTIARWYPSHDGPGRGTFVADLVEATRPWAEHRVVSFDRLLVRGTPHLRPAIAAEARAAADAVAGAGELWAMAPAPAAPGVPVARAPLVRLPGDTGPDALVDDHLAALRPVVARLRETWRPDVLHAHTGLPDGAAAVALGRELGIPVVASEHMSTLATVLASPEARARYAPLVGPAPAVVAVSPHVGRQVAALVGVPADRVPVIPNPVRTDLFALADPAARDPDELLWVGKLAESKGTDVLLRAFALLRAARPALRLRLLGAPADAATGARLHALAADLGVAGTVAFEGWQPRNAVAAAMARAAVLVHASPYETFGVVAAEAILRGLPVAARRSGGVPWVIELSGGFGEVAADDGDAAFAAAVERVLERRLSMDPVPARASLAAAVGAEAVGRAWADRYATAVGVDPATIVERRVEVGASPAGPEGHALPLVVAGTGRDEALALVAQLPASLRERLTLVTIAGATSPPDGAAPARMVTVATGAAVSQRGGLRARIVRRAARVTGAERRRVDRERREWSAAIARAVEAYGNGIRQAVAIDAPAAAAIATLRDRGIGLAPGSLRWLADRHGWSADARAVEDGDPDPDAAPATAPPGAATADPDAIPA